MRYTCEKCGRIYSDRHNSNRHRRTVHRSPVNDGSPNSPKCFRMETKPLECAQCGENFNYREALTNHKKRNHYIGNKMRYTCEKCGRTFSDRHNRNKHRRTVHRPPVNDGSPNPPKCPRIEMGPLECAECGEHFNYRGALQDHKKRNHFIVYECNECGRRYKRKYSLIHHYRTFSCPATHSDPNTLA